MRHSIGYALAVALGVAFATAVPAMSDIFTGFDITDRGTLDFGVPFVRSGAEYGNNKPTALDVGPRGNPGDASHSGKAWIDVCNADLIANPNAPVSCLYAGAWSDHMEFGSRSFNGAPVVPLKLRIGNVVVGELNSTGLVIYGTITAGAFAGGALPPDPPPPPPEGVETFAGGGQFRAIPSNPFGTGDFTYDFWVNSSQTSRADILTQADSYTAPNWHGLLLNVGGSGKVQWYENDNVKITATAGWNDGQWHHVAIVRLGNTVTLYLDGVSKGSSTTSFTYGNASVGLRLGAPSYSGGSFVGWVDDFRLIGEARWSGNFTPPARTS